MAQQVEDKKILRIPKTIKTKTEFFVGFGVAELVRTLIITGISCIVAYIVYLAKNETITPVFIVIISATVSVVLFTKNSINFSLFDYLVNIIKFHLSQKEYKYRKGGSDLLLSLGEKNK